MLEDLIRSIGTDRFSSMAFAFLRDKLSIRHLTIVRFAQNRPVEFFAIESDGSEQTFYPAIDHYMRGSYAGDPLCSFYHASEKSEHRLFSVRADQVLDREVREQLYSSVGIAGKLSLVIRRHCDALALSVHRSQKIGCFSSKDIDTMRALSGVLAATVERHVSILEPPALDNLAELTKLVGEVPSALRLSKQEIVVCAHIVMGYSTESIALNLGVSTHSIATYRRRAYAKLNVSSQNELFLLLLGLCARRVISMPRVSAGTLESEAKILRNITAARGRHRSAQTYQ
jgi:DNA-binding CsgD family transcriptional regulator